MNLDKLSVEDAKLVQRGLNALGFYEGSFRGKPGPKTKAAYERYLRASQPRNLPTTLGAELVRQLKREIGIREIPKDSNSGPRVREYQASTWLEGTGWPWCAAFICWGLHQIDKRHRLPFDRPRTPSAWGFEAWAKKEDLNLMKPRKQILAGDIVCFTFSHIGLAIEDEKDGYVKTVEGNTNTSGSREGGGVYEQNRKVSLIRSHIRLD